MLSTLTDSPLTLIIGVAHVALAIVVSAHIVLTKSDVRAALGWVALVWLSPVVGSAPYAILGVNRIRRRARGERALARKAMPELPRITREEELSMAIPAGVPEQWRSLATLVGRITGLPLTDGNAVSPLVNGDAAYPAMIAAIDSAERSVGFSTYIMDRGVAASGFVEAFARAVRRGVTVRVLIDDVGARYSRPSIVESLRDRGVRVARFLPSIIPLASRTINLRNHRKILVVDGTIGFCGGINVRDGCLLANNPPNATQDVHFAIRGPVVSQLVRAFAFDWNFTTGEALNEEEWTAPAVRSGTVAARGVPDGPDEDFEALDMTLLGAVSQATKSVRIVTPYFLPDAPLLDALRVAALRGVEVDIVLPEKGNLPTVQWASMPQLPQLIARGCRVHFSAPPFDHSKLLVVDGAWSMIGSANWDPRSLRLNFEYNVECYCTDLATQLNAIIDAKVQRSRRVTLYELSRRHIALRLRDGIVRLAQPYL